MGYRADSAAPKDSEEETIMASKQAEFAKMPTAEVHALYVKETEAERGANERATVLRAVLVGRQALADKKAELAKLAAEVAAAEAKEGA